MKSSDEGGTTVEHDELRVDPAGRAPTARRPDADILAAVRENLADAPDVDAEDITVDVQNGEVVLEGVVPVASMVEAAEDVANGVWGVGDVHNHLRVRGG